MRSITQELIIPVRNKDKKKKGFIDLGKGKLTHDVNGFVLEGEYKEEAYSVIFDAKLLYSCHIEYNYLGKHGD